MTNQAFFMKHQTFGDVLVEVTHCEDRGDFWYVSWRPVHWLDGRAVKNSDMLGQWGTRRFYKDRRHGDTFRRAPVMIRSAPHMGWGVLAGITVSTKVGGARSCS